MTTITKIKPMRHPYSQINPNVKALLSSNKLAQKAIESWIQVNTNPTFYNRNSHNSFANINGSYYVSMRNVALWTGEPKPNLYSRLLRNYDMFAEFGTVCYEDDDTNRLEAALTLGLDKYAQMTSSIYLFSPRSVLLFLLSSRYPKAESFQEYIQDWGIGSAYSLPKLFVTLQQKEITNVEA
jgi:hypothetical protein